MNIQLDPRVAGKLLASSLAKSAVNRRRLHLLDLRGELRDRSLQCGNTPAWIIAARALRAALCGVLSFRHCNPPYV
ncbi:MAG: hypothetical protein AAB562_01300 [Patescibacteria group bacterium]